MSAVIWCGIVAVWVFVLIPTWVRRGDIHWNRGIAVAPQVSDRAARSRGSRVPFTRSWRDSRATVSHAESSLEVEASMAEQNEAFQETYEDEYEMEQPVHASGVASRARVAAAATSGKLSGAVRASLGHMPKGGPERKTKPLRVRRARRLVGLAALAFVTLILAIVASPLLWVVNLLADASLFFYMRHLRGIARAQQARVAREKRARAARQAWEQASAQERASQIDGWGSHEAAPVTLPYQAAPQHTETEYAETEYAETRYTETQYDAVGELTDDVFAIDDDEYSRQEQLDLAALEQPELHDLTDAPTEELLAAKAS
jgi:hypothetical protein